MSCENKIGMSMQDSTFFIFASSAESLLSFRGPLIAALVSLQVKVHVAAPGLLVNSVIHNKLFSMGVTCHELALNRTGLNPFKDMTSLIELHGLLNRVKPDVLLAYTIKPVIYGLLAARFNHVPRRYALITGLGYAFTGQASGKRALVQWFARKLYRQALKSASLVFFQNPDDQQVFKALGLLSQDNPSLVVNGSGIDLDAFPVVPLATNKPVFLLIARLLGDKGVREYVQAAKRLGALHPESRFLLVGGLDTNPDGISQTELDEWVNGNLIEYLGHLNDVKPAIAQSSVYVLPSYREGTPRSVLEAMAMGRPIITTDAPGCRETVIDGENGFLVPVKSVDALVTAMQRFIDQPDLIEPMGKRSRQIAEDKYDVHKVNAVMLKAMGITGDGAAA